MDKDSLRAFNRAMEVAANQDAIAWADERSGIVTAGVIIAPVEIESSPYIEPVGK